MWLSYTILKYFCSIFEIAKPELAVFCYQNITILNFYIPVAPRIDRKNLQQKKVRVGHFLKIEADITGEPPPTVTWTFAGKTIGKSDR